MATKRKTEKNRNAAAIAKDCRENHFPSRRGIGAWAATDEKKPIGFYYYDNNPFSDLRDGTSPRRDAMIAELVAIMAERGCRVVERASYPKTDPKYGQEGYTLALIFESEIPSRVSEDCDAFIGALAKALTREVAA